MKNQRFIRNLLLLTGIWMLPAFGKAQNCDVLSTGQLREMLVQLGYSVKDISADPGKEKYEVTHVKDGYNVPIAYEISPSSNYIWLTAFLGQAKTEVSSNQMDLLKQNFSIQPCQFYITSKGNLMMGLAAENRGITNAILRRHTEKIVADVAGKVSYWKN